MNNIFIKAEDVMLGDNVWEHCIVSAITHAGNKVIFNEGQVTEWVMREDDDAMVTNRRKNHVMNHPIHY